MNLSPTEQKLLFEMSKLIGDDREVFAKYIDWYWGDDAEVSNIERIFFEAFNKMFREGGLA